MNGNHFSQLRSKAKMTQAAAAAALGISPETVAGWESTNQTFPSMATTAIQDSFVPKLLDGPLSHMVAEAFLKIPSELVAIWFVHGNDCILRPSGVRREPLSEDMTEVVKAPSPVCIAPLDVESLTTYPLRTGETLNLAGDDIRDHPAKKYKTLAASHFAGGQCESLLHIPAFLPSDGESIPVLLLSLENRLDENNKVVTVEGGKRGVRVYDREAKAIAERLVQRFSERLAEYLRLLDML